MLSLPPHPTPTPLRTPYTPPDTPGAVGLSVTSDGRPKVIDIIDCAGAGDVDTSKTVQLAPGATTLTGLTGRTLQLGAWCEGVTTFHVGVLAGYSLFPKPLTTRLRKSRRDRFDEEQRASVNAAERDLAAFEGLNKAAGPAAAPLATEKAEEKAELTERLAQLKALAAAFEDPGPVYDCVVFNDGTLWRAVVDVGCAGDLTAAPLMANFREAQQYVEALCSHHVHSIINDYQSKRCFRIM